MGVCSSILKGGDGVSPSAGQKPKVIIVGASGYVGKATLSSLSSRHGKHVEIYAGVRDPSKFEEMENVKAVKADMGNKEELTATLKDYDRAYIVSPGHEDRTELAMNGLEAAKDAGSIKFVAVVSVLTCGTDSVFGKQFDPVESKAKELDIPYCILRLPLFMDNNMLNAQSVKEQNTFYDPRDPAAPMTCVAVSDVGKASADILAKPDKHKNTTYKLVGPSFTLNDLAAVFTDVTGKEVTVTTVPYDAAKESFMGNGFPEWQVDGILELFKYIDEKSEITNETKDTGDIEKITGDKPTSIQDWVKQNADAFK